MVINDECYDFTIKLPMECGGLLILRHSDDGFCDAPESTA